MYYVVKIPEIIFKNNAPFRKNKAELKQNK